MPSVVRFNVNGRHQEVSIENNATLADLLRGHLGLNVPLVCDNGASGASLVLVDGQLMDAALVLAMAVRTRAVQTVAGLDDRVGLAVARAFAATGADACPVCTSGMRIAATQAIRVNPWIDADEARTAIAGNVCRCSGYDLQVEAIMLAATDLQSEGRSR